MDLTQPLINLVNKVNGAYGAILADNEGEEVTSYAVGEKLALPQREMTERMKLIGAYQAINLHSYRQMMEQLQAGNLNQMICSYMDATILIRAINKDYALILAMQPEGNIGKGLFYLNQAADVLRADM